MPRFRRSRLVLLAAFGLVVLCVGGLGAVDARNAALEQRTAPAATPIADRVVDIHFLRYGPDPIEIQAGQTVTWINQDALPHTVTAKSGNVPQSEALGLEDRYQQAFAEPGTYDYICLFHAQMHGTVIVREAAFGQATPPATLAAVEAAV